MSTRYVLKFTKSGYVKYISHLDLLRLFKRAFKKTGLALKYSQGFNPHPKMGFAQPLSLGYSSICELIEFETIEPHELESIKSKMQGEMPEGIEITECTSLSDDIKSLASDADEAEYVITIPTSLDENILREKLEQYLQQTEIFALKRQKKTKKMEPVSIKHMLRQLKIEKKDGDESAVLTADLDCGSKSNCSPELVIASFCSFAGIDTPRYEMEVERTKIKFVNKLQF